MRPSARVRYNARGVQIGRAPDARDTEAFRRARRGQVVEADVQGTGLVRVRWDDGETAMCGIMYLDYDMEVARSPRTC
jgi:hypothetical protein